MPKTNGEQTEENEGSYFYLYPFEDLAQGSFQRSLHQVIFVFENLPN
jgi:hypothetical protein